MPTKPNKAGNQQNYVPAGNGDASGEYGDNATGSNVHFTNFKRPEKVEVEVNKGDENISVVSKPNDKPTGETFKDYVANNHKDNFGTALTKNYEVGTDDAKDLVDKMIKHNGVKIEKASGISNYSGSVNLNNIESFNEYSSKVEGETFYHEFWHCFDERFAHDTVDANGEIIHKGLITKEDMMHIASDLRMRWNLSTGKVLSNGLTLFETIKKEAFQMSKKGIWSQMQNDFKNEVDEEFKKTYPDANSIYTQINSMDDDFREKANKEYPGDWYKRIEYADKLRNENKEYQDLRSKRREMELFKSKVQAKASRSWMSISDMYGIHKKVSHGFCGGHAGNYGKMPGAMALEFTAEMGSALSRTDEYAKKEIAILEKYMPETSKMFRELREMVLNSAKEYK